MALFFVYFKVKPSQQVNFCWPQKHIVGKKSEMYANRARMSLENFTGLYLGDYWMSLKLVRAVKAWSRC